MFQSTPLLRGATEELKLFGQTSKVSIHAPLARGDVSAFSGQFQFIVSIHAPLARGDPSHASLIALSLKFQSTPLLRGATEVLGHVKSRLDVSIHAPLARGDTKCEK